MKFKSLIIAAFAVALSCAQAFGQATILPPGETCFSALAPTSGGPGQTGTGFIGLLGTITGGSGYTNGTYGGVALTGGSGTSATANITVSGGAVTSVAILNPGINYVAGDTISATAASIGGTGSGFSVGVSSVAINYALAGGSVGFFIPNSLVIKQTWQDAGENTLNQNPVPLDANGCAVIYGAGIYRMIVKDSLGNTVYDKLTASTGPAGLFWAGTAGGTGNAITITDTNFALQDGATIQFRAFANNSGPTTISVSSGTPIAVVKDTSSGPAALSGGEIAVGNSGGGNVPIVTYDLPNNEFHLVNPASSGGGGGGSGGSLIPPQGYLTLDPLASGGPVQGSDIVSVATIFYSPYNGDLIPIFNGTVFVNTQFSELTMTLTATGSPASTIQDACIFNNNGAPTLVLGPSWQNVGLGTGSRGTGAGTTQINKLQGIWVNSVAITGYNGLSSFSIPASQCTYVGSVYIDATAGQVSAYTTWGLTRKFGIWNAYNRQQITLQEGDSSTNWSYTTNAWRQANAGTTANNYLDVFSGLPEESFELEYEIQVSANPTISPAGSVNLFNGIGVNSTTIPFGTEGRFTLSNQGSSAITYASILYSKYFAPRSVGVNRIYPLENGGGGTSGLYIGGTTSMQLSAKWRG